VQITFSPTEEESYGGPISVASDKTSGTASLSISGAGLPVPTRILELSLNADFGSVVIGESTSQLLTLSNTGNDTLAVSSISLPAGFSGAWSGSIEPGESQSVQITFSPTEEESYGGSISVASDKTSGTASLSISGAGSAVSRTLAIVLDADFENTLVGETSQSTLTLSNTGNSDISISGFTVPNGFAGTWSGMIEAGETQRIEISFAPLAATTYGGLLNVSSDMTGGTSSIELFGTGIYNSDLQKDKTTFENWIGTYDLSDSEKFKSTDADGDGYTNVVEFIYNLNPTVFDSVAPYTYQLIRTPKEGAVVRFLEQANHRPRTLSWELRTSPDVSAPSVEATPTEVIEVDQGNAGVKVSEVYFSPDDKAGELYIRPHISIE
jgi:hypothetical protein